MHLKIKKYIFNLFLIVPLIVSSQTKELDIEFFLYGINYIHYSYLDHKLQKVENQIDIFFDASREDIIAEYLIEQIKKSTLDAIEIKRIDKGSNYVSNRDDNLSQYYLYSEFIKKGLNKYFTSDFIAQQEILPFYKDKEKVYSFITGAYLRDGEKINDTIYKISIPVSKKVAYCYSMLKKSSATNVVYKQTEKSNTDPNAYLNPISTVYFNPSPDLKEYLSIIEEIPTKKERIKLKYLAIFEDKKRDKKTAKKKY